MKKFIRKCSDMTYRKRHTLSVFLWTGLFCLVMHLGLAALIKNVNQKIDVRNYNYYTNAETLRSVYEDKQRDWVYKCISGAGKGFLVGEKSTSELPKSCAVASVDLFPWKDWDAIAEKNKVIHAAEKPKG